MSSKLNIYFRSELWLQIQNTLRLGCVSFPPLSCLDRRIFSLLYFLQRGLLHFVFLWVTSNSISVQHKSFGKAEDLQPQLPRRTSSLPGEAVLIPRDSIFSYGTRSPWSNNILWPVIYGRGENRDRVGLQVWVSSYYHPTLKGPTLYSAGRHQRAAKFPSLSLPKDSRKRERTRVNRIAKSCNRHLLLRWTRFLTGMPVWIYKKINLKFLQTN